jgi:hypothetical protein
MNNDEIYILYTNTDSLINKINDLKIIIDSLEIKPHIVAITEAKSKH